jgi:hypothetical protein
MIKDYTNVFLGLILILPGIYLLWYANGHADFYRERRWEKWHGRAYLLSIFFSLICRFGGIDSVKHSFRLFALTCIGVGIWTTFAI